QARRGQVAPARALWLRTFAPPRQAGLGAARERADCCYEPGSTSASEAGAGRASARARVLRTFAPPRHAGLVAARERAVSGYEPGSTSASEAGAGRASTGA